MDSESRLTGINEIYVGNSSESTLNASRTGQTGWDGIATSHFAVEEDVGASIDGRTARKTDAAPKPRTPLVGKNEWAAECCIGLAVYAKTVIEGAATTLISGLEGRVAAAGNRIMELTSKLAGTGESLKEQVAAAVEDLRSGDRAGMAPDREGIRARQILVDGFPLGGDDALSEVSILAKANEALDFLPREVLDIPEGLRFTAAKTLRNGGVVLEMTSAELVKWLVAHAQRFEVVLSEQAKIRPRQYKLVAEFTPVSFDPSREEAVP
ncbi:hypothetical protein BD309DRAFT_981066 [Dichomitus squalens]|nr:hypothetical protein BD309DRAFT_981066 [Dichomitus squalens]